MIKINNNIKTIFTWNFDTRFQFNNIASNQFLSFNLHNLAISDHNTLRRQHILESFHNITSLTFLVISQESSKYHHAKQHATANKISLFATKVVTQQTKRGGKEEQTLQTSKAVFEEFFPLRFARRRGDGVVAILFKPL